MLVDAAKKCIATEVRGHGKQSVGLTLQYPKLINYCILSVWLCLLQKLPNIEITLPMVSWII